MSIEQDPDLTLDLFFDAWELFREATLAGTWAGALLGFLGVYIVLQKMIFLSAALSQASSFGVAASFYLKLKLLGTGENTGHHELGEERLLPPPESLSDSIWQRFADPHWMAGTVTLFVIAFISWFGRASRAKGERTRDHLLGFVYLVGAAGTLLLGTRIVEEVQDIQSLITGDAVVVLPEDLLSLQYVTVGLLALHIWWMKGIIEVTMDPIGAKARGLPTLTLQFILLASLALAVVMTTQILGALPVFALSVLPAMAALRLSINVPVALFLATLFGAFAGFSGYLVAFLYAFPVGASQAICAALLVVAAEGLRQLLNLSKMAWIHIAPA